MFGFQGSQILKRINVATNTAVQTDYAFNIIARYDLGDTYYRTFITVNGNSSMYVYGRSLNLPNVNLLAFNLQSSQLLWNIQQPTDTDSVAATYVTIVGDGSLIWSDPSTSSYRVKSCSIHGVCSTISSKCDCDHKWNGSSCSICANTCSNNGICNIQGDCVCNGHWDGNACSSCETNWTGPNCTLCNMYCGHGQCSDIGTCICDSDTWHKYSGDICERSTLSFPSIALIVLGSTIFPTVLVISIYLIWKRVNSKDLMRGRYEVIQNKEETANS